MAVYDELIKSLRERIVSGAAGPGESLGTELGLAESFGISRSSVRTAVGQLVEEGLVERVAGRGLFVRAQVHPQVALVVPSLVDIWRDVAEAAKEVALERQVSLQIHSAYGDLVADLRTLRELRAQPVQGLLIGSLHRMELNERLIELWRERFPFVVLDQSFTDIDLPTVRFDDVAAGRMAAEHLLELGHRRIAYVGFQGRSRNGRGDGVRDALNDAGIAMPTRQMAVIPLEELSRGFLLPPEAQLRELFTGADRPSAVVCHNDFVAEALLRQLQGWGLSVPEDLSMVIIAGTRPSGLRPSFTSVLLPAAEMGRAAIQMLLDHIADTDLPARQQVLPPVLHPGGSTYPAEP